MMIQDSAADKKYLVKYNTLFMPFEIGGSINYLADKFLSAPTIHNIAKNPIYTALLITFIIIIIIMFVFRDIDAKESLLVMSMRAGFWILFMLLGILLLHNKVLSRETEEFKRSTEYENVFSGVYGGANIPGQLSKQVFEDSIVPVKINTEF